MSETQIQEGPHYVCQKLRVEFWAENGLITVVDTDKAGDESNTVDDCIKRLRPVEFLERAASVRLRYLHATMNDQRWSALLMEQAEKAVKLALSQGDPLDPAVQRYHAKHTRKSSIAMPAPQGRYKIQHPSDPRKAILDGVQVVPDFSIAPGQRITPAMSGQISEKIRNRRR